MNLDELRGRVDELQTEILGLADADTLTDEQEERLDAAIPELAEARNELDKAETRGAELAGHVDLLDRIATDGLLDAIADGTFGLMKRPADHGKGLDGVIVRAPDYDNPAVTLLETGATR